MRGPSGRGSQRRHAVGGRVQDGAAIKAAGDQGNAYNLVGLGDMRLVRHEAPDEKSETDTCGESIG
jgi:hypothetical protein